MNYYPNFATVDDLLLSSYNLDDFAQILSRGRVARALKFSFAS